MPTIKQYRYLPLDFHKAQVDLEGSINGYNEALYSAKIAEMELYQIATKMNLKIFIFSILSS